MKNQQRQRSIARYTDVFVTNSKDLESIKEVDYGNDTDEEAVTKEDQNQEVTKIQDEAQMKSEEAGRKFHSNSG